MQLKEYIQGTRGIRNQCEEFNSIVARKLKDGIGYAYCSIDKNEFVVCLKCRNYHKAVETIQALHMIQNNAVVYGYSIFSVSQKVLESLSPVAYRDLYDETIESICFKGITNSIRNQELNLRLDEKYYDFCEKLAHKLYLGDERKEIENADAENVSNKTKDRTYDILGDDDFRYIAREVKLGRLLYEYRKEGMLSYTNRQFTFYLFSSSLVLNTMTEANGKAELEERKVYEAADKLAESMIPEYCNEVMMILEEIYDTIQNKYKNDDKILSIYYALYQLLQSFKVLELSPAKRYDFFSMFPPFKMLVEIVRQKLKEEEGRKIVERNEMFEFIHKISMTFHSAQRTDIQFFQIQDFNVIVHYAPAKLRAFYAVWILELADLYKKFKQKPDKDYSFIFAPGMFGVTKVRQLYDDCKESRRLMLVTLPDRSVYHIKKLLIVLSHEAAHIGCERQREERHGFALKACIRAVLLEMHAFMMCEIKNAGGQMKTEVFIEKVRRNRLLLQEMEELLEDENQTILQQFGDKQPDNKMRDDECRRSASMRHIDEAFGKMIRKYGNKIIADYCSCIKNVYIAAKKGGRGDSCYLMCVGKVCYNAQREMIELIKMFRNIQLKKILQIFYHIEEEAFSDLITILTMEHSLEDYIFSFTSDEIAKEDVAGDNVTTAVIVRMTLVIETLCKVARHSWMRMERPDFVKEWSGNRLKKLCKKFPRNSIEERIAAEVLCYKSAIRDSLNRIDQYKRMYDVSQHGYTDTLYGFLTDQVVWNALCDYLYISADAYINTLINNKEVNKQRYDIVNVYKSLKNGSFTDAVQIIENYLYRYEMRVRD